MAQNAGPAQHSVVDGPVTQRDRRSARRSDEAREERQVWLATSAYAAMVGVLLLLLGQGKLTDPETMGGIAGAVLAVTLLWYAFRRVLSVRAAALSGTTSRPARGMLLLFGTLTGITLACVVVSAVTG